MARSRMTDHTSADWQRLADRIRERRLEVAPRSKQGEFAETAGLGARVYSQLETAARTSYGRDTIIRLEQALDWAPGSVAAILDGEEPTDRSPADDDQPVSLREDDNGGMFARIAATVDVLLPEDGNPPAVVVLDRATGRRFQVKVTAAPGDDVDALEALFGRVLDEIRDRGTVLIPIRGWGMHAPAAG